MTTSDRLSTRGKILLDSSISEGKRFGRAVTDVACLLLAVDRAQGDGPAGLDVVFGDGFAVNLKLSAGTLKTVGDEGSVVTILLQADTDQSKSVAQLALEAMPSLPELVSIASTTPSQPATAPKLSEEGGSPARDQAPAGAVLPEPSLTERPPDIAPAELAERLRARVRGQNEAIETVTRRLALTRAELDMRPERPDGVFLFVGPTGVGKTALAIALAGELMGSEDAIIRLDMSEYAGDWAISRLTGPMPGYVGSDQPESWLTTKVMRQPHSVVLLDEVEKAHPAVWSIFLQAFDAGRLTDSRGKTADFSKTVVLMTSNLGADVFNDRPVGFIKRDGEDSIERAGRESGALTESVRAALPPELLNRLDGVITFRALEQDHIAEIGELALDRTIERLGDRGIKLKVTKTARRHLVEVNYDRRYGARHLQRNIESMLLEPIAMSGLDGGVVSVTIKDGQLSFS